MGRSLCPDGVPWGLGQGRYIKFFHCNLKINLCTIMDHALCTIELLVQGKGNYNATAYENILYTFNFVSTFL